MVRLAMMDRLQRVALKKREEAERGDVNVNVEVFFRSEQVGYG